MLMKEYTWVAELATDCKNYADSLGFFFSRAISKVDLPEVSSSQLKRSWSVLARDMVHLGFDEEDALPPDIEATIEALQFLGIKKLEENLVDEQKLAEALGRTLQKLLETIGAYPTIFEMLDQVDLLEDMVGTIAKRYLPLFKLFPAFSNEALSIIPYLKEPLFTALYELPEPEHLRLTQLTHKVLHSFYNNQVRPKLVETLKDNLKGRNLLLPLIDEAVNHLPDDRCMTALISILCTPRDQLTQGRIISIVLQELGGMYVKLAQVLAELAPPSLARELRHQQDKLGGIFGSQEKSWKYVLKIFERPSWSEYKEYIKIPNTVHNAFAGASVGAIYEFELTEIGKIKFETTGTVLLKVQRPGLTQLFEEQKATLLAILNHLDKSLDTSDLSIEDISEVRSLIMALNRTIINYAAQSIGELDFRIEKKNAENVKEALKGAFNLQVPDFYHVETDVVLMGRIRGEKITSVVHSRYLERMTIADIVTEAYLYMMFQKGIIWADPHAGNILYDADNLQIKLIDLNPCFTWDQTTVREFFAFLYRLILNDQKGIFEGLSKLVENPEELSTEKGKKVISDFITNENQGEFIRSLSDLVRLLSEANINLRIEVQAALRGLSQVYLTANAISSRNNFGKILQKQFGWRKLVKLVFAIGPFKVLRSLLPIAFSVVRNSPEQEVGPTLDERDISAIEQALKILNTENVCNIEFVRNSPEENTQLTLAADGSSLIKSTNLKIEIQTETKPASVKYIVEAPTKEWLKERQEYIKLQGMGFTLCLVECLEQLRRHSLEDYWSVVESWSLSTAQKSPRANMLIGEVKLAARVLFTKRYSNIWTSEFISVSFWNRYLWKILIRFEERFERREQGYFSILSKKMGKAKVGELTFGTLQRLKIIAYRLIISGLKSLIKSSRFEMNLLPLPTEDLIHRMLHGLLRRGLNNNVKSDT
jgi:predicted unusual protein kinase regulating ubiquinone biosynthesis (AarF/ABC1/UbiB family)